jgi:hypothetical protein
MKSAFFLITVLILLITSDMINALPRFAVKLGDRCIDCHYNPSGGIIRSENGWHWGKNTLSMISTPDKDFIMSPRISDNISIGIDYRMQYLYSQEKKRTDFQKMSGAVYTNIALSSKINIIGKYDFVNDLWEGYAVAQIFPNNSYIKVGSFVPNYGIRLDDHTAYSRGGDFGLLFSQGVYRGLIYNPFYNETGIELGVYADKFLYATASVGSNNISPSRPLAKDPTITTRIELTPKIKSVGLLLGGSFASVKTPDKVNIFGGFAGLGYDEFSLLAEYDIAENLLQPDTKTSVMMIEFSYGIITGLDAVIRYDRITPDINLTNEAVSRFIIGFEFQPYSFIEVRPQYRLQIEEPSVKNDSFVLQFHFWY